MSALLVVSPAMAAPAPAVAEPVSGGSVTISVLVIVIVVSMLVALLIKGFTAILGRNGGSSAAPAGLGASSAAPAGAAGGRPAGTAGALTAAGHDPRHVAAISAAVAGVFDDAAVVVHIEPVRGAGWAAEGRTAHHTSHNVGRTHPGRRTP